MTVSSKELLILKYPWNICKILGTIKVMIYVFYFVAWQIPTICHYIEIAKLLWLSYSKTILFFITKIMSNLSGFFFEVC